MNLNQYFVLRLGSNPRNTGMVQARRITESIPGTEFDLWPDVKIEYLVAGKWITGNQIIKKVRESSPTLQKT